MANPGDARDTGSLFSDTAERATDTDAMSETDRRLQRWRHMVGLLIIAFVVFLWTATNFLASAVLADHSFSKPFFVSYLNTSFFILPLLPALAHKAYKEPGEIQKFMSDCKTSIRHVLTFGFQNRVRKNDLSGRISRGRRSDDASRERLLSDPGEPSHGSNSVTSRAKISAASQLSMFETAKLSMSFCFLWFVACYFLLACLEHTTVASSTILTATTSVFTLIFGVIAGVEKFTLRKLAGVLSSLAGVILISSVDYSGKSSDEEHRGHFPEKSAGELTLGNTLALLSAVLYGIYTVFMKRRIPDENKVSMPIFFGFVGLINVLCLWPGFLILHYTGWETFELPTAGRVTWILLLNATGSMLSDIAWAYAVLLTSPILVTVGLSLNIPLSLVGQMVLNSQTSTALYWVGAFIVVLSFVAVN